MITTKKWLLAASLSSIMASAYAGTDEDGRIWLSMTAQGDLPAQGLRWYAELQPRWRQEGSHLDSVLVRPAVYYKLSDTDSIWLGYGYIPSFPASGGTLNENRLWQQYLHAFAPWNGIALSSRTRLEERWLEHGDDTGYRLRQMLRASHQFEGNPQWGAVVWDELFVNANSTDWGARSGFDQNRAFAGISYAFSNTFKAEVGYLNQYVRTKADDRVNQVLATTLSFNF